MAIIETLPTRWTLSLHLLDAGGVIWSFPREFCAKGAPLGFADSFDTSGSGVACEIGAILLGIGQLAFLFGETRRYLKVAAACAGATGLIRPAIVMYHKAANGKSVDIGALTNRHASSIPPCVKRYTSLMPVSADPKLALPHF